MFPVDVRLNGLAETQNANRFSAAATRVATGIAILTCLFGQLGAMGLVGPDEPRYAWIARAMARTGDWVTPRLYGQPWFEKPVLYYWAAGLGFLVHLPSEWAARLPSAFAALVAAVTIGWLAWRYYGARARSLRDPALLAPLLFSTTVAAIGFARAATPDMLFSASLTLAMACAAWSLSASGSLRAPAWSVRSRGDYLALILLGAFLGLAVLAKGPAGVVLAGGAVILWALLTRHWRGAFRLLHPIAIAAFCVVALPWYILCALRNPDFVRVFILQQNFERYLTPVFHHQQPFWFFGPIVLLALLPWTVLLWPVAREGLRLRREKAWSDSPGFFFACWAVFPVLFFSFSQSKLPSYILPSIPALVLLCSVASVRACESRRRMTAGLGLGLAATWITLAIVAVRATHRINWDAAVPGFAQHGLHSLNLALVLCAAVAALLMLFWGARQKFTLVAAVSVLCALVAVEIANRTVLPVLGRFYSARTHAAFFRHDLHPERIFTYDLPRNWDYGLAFYFHRHLPEWSPADSRPALVLTTTNGLTEIRKLGRFHGNVYEPNVGILYVPVEIAPR